MKNKTVIYSEYWFPSMGYLVFFEDRIYPLFQFSKESTLDEKKTSGVGAKRFCETTSYEVLGSLEDVLEIRKQFPSLFYINGILVRENLEKLKKALIGENPAG
jgi:hypothetical protein